MTREVGGIEVSAKEGLFCHLLTPSRRPATWGTTARWSACWTASGRCGTRSGVYFAEAVGILDLFHVLERLWAVAHCFHAEGSDEAEQFVEDRLRDLLRGGSVMSSPGCGGG